jgi:PBP1b-binding outer membrane lipoprotein LpoB
MRAIVAVLFLLLLTGCQSGPSGRLSTDNVQKAVDQLIDKCKCKISGSTKVVAVTETEGGNAIADVKFIHFMDNQNEFYRAPWDGIGKAQISRLRDGSIVLTKVDWSIDHTCAGPIPL